MDTPFTVADAFETGSKPLLKRRPYGHDTATLSRLLWQRATLVRPRFLLHPGYCRDVRRR